MKHEKYPIIIAGDHCWMLSDGLLYFVEVTSVCIHFPNEPNPYVDITVRAGDTQVYEHVARFRLFQYPDERSRLCQELNDTAERLTRYAEDYLLGMDPETGEDEEMPTLGLL